jgi:hypothetical protein
MPSEVLMNPSFTVWAIAPGPVRTNTNNIFSMHLIFFLQKSVGPQQTSDPLETVDLLLKRWKNPLLSGEPTKR